MSAIALGAEVAAATSTDATTHTTAAFQGGADGTFVFISVIHTAVAATAMNTPTGTSIRNMNKLDSLPLSATQVQDIWVGKATGTSSAIVFHYNETATGAIWTVQEFLNVDGTRGVNNTIGGIAANQAQNSGVGTTFSNPLSYHIQHTANALVAVWGSNDSGGHNVTGEAGWTEVDDQSLGGSPAVAQSVYWRIGEDLTPTATIGASVSWVGYAIELWGNDASGDWHDLETFTKADGTGWGNDQLWSTAIAGVPTVLSNQAASLGSGVWTENILTNDSSSSNHEGRVIAATMPLSGNCVIGIKLRGTSLATDCYEFVRVGATTLGAYSVVLRYRNTSGVYTNLAGPTVVARAGVSTPEQLYFTAVGNTLTCYLDGVQVLATTSTLITASRNRGGLVIRCNTSQDTLADNFQFGDIGKTNSPKAFASTGATTAAKAKASLTKKWTSLAKSGTADQAFGNLSSRIARFTTRSGSATSARATSFATQVEGFSVTRRYLTKAGTASSAKGTITTGNKTFAGKIPSTTFSGGVFHPIFLDVKKGQQGARITASNSAKATLIKNVGQSTKVFQSDNATGYIQGLTTRFNVTVPTVSNVTVIIGGTTSFFVKVPQVQGLVVAEWIFPPGLGGVFVCPINDDELPTTTVQKQIGDRLMRHYRPRPVGRNVYIYSDGTVSENDPDGYSTLWRESARMGDTPLGIPTVVRVFFGGHDGEPVTQTEAQLLVAAGYTVRGYHP